MSKYTCIVKNIFQAFGYVLYEILIERRHTIPVELSAPLLADYAYVYVDNLLQAILYRQDGQTKATIHVTSGQTLRILVENMGRNDFSLNSVEGLHDIKVRTVHDGRLSIFNS